MVMRYWWRGILGWGRGGATYSYFYWLLGRGKPFTVTATRIQYLFKYYISILVLYPPPPPPKAISTVSK